MRAILGKLGRPEALVHVAFVLLLMLFGRHRFFQDPGTYWHVVLGQDLLNTGRLTRADSFTFTHAGQPWLALQWLGECAMAWGFARGGWDLLLLATVTLLATLYTWIFHRLLRDGLHWLPAGLLLVVVIGASTHHFHVRPHLASMVGMAVTFALLLDVDSGRRRFLALGWLLPLFVVWANVHGGVLAGGATVGLAIMGWTVLYLTGRPGPLDSPRAVVASLLLIPALGLTFLLNPYGIDAPVAWLTIMSLPLPELIDEHRGLALTSPEGMMIVSLSGIYLVCLADALRQKRRFAWFIPLVWILLAFSRVRHAPLLAVVAPLAIADILPHTRISRRMARTECFFPQPAARTWSDAVWGAVLPLLLVASVLCIQSAAIELPVVGRGWAGPGEDRWPTAALRQLDDLPDGQDRDPRLFNELDFGGYIVLHAPRWKTFIDDRCELFGGEFLTEYLNAHREPELIDHWSRRFGFDVALIRRDGTLDRYLDRSPHWKLVRRDRAASLYVLGPRHTEFDPAEDADWSETAPVSLPSSLPSSERID